LERASSRQTNVLGRQPRRSIRWSRARAGRRRARLRVRPRFQLRTQRIIRGLPCGAPRSCNLPSNFPQRPSKLPLDMIRRGRRMCFLRKVFAISSEDLESSAFRPVERMTSRTREGTIVRIVEKAGTITAPRTAASAVERPMRGPFENFPPHGVRTRSNTAQRRRPGQRLRAASIVTRIAWVVREVIHERTPEDSPFTSSRRRTPRKWPRPAQSRLRRRRAAGDRNRGKRVEDIVTPARAIRTRATSDPSATRGNASRLLNTPRRPRANYSGAKRTFRPGRMPLHDSADGFALTHATIRPRRGMRFTMRRNWSSIAARSA